MTEQKEAHRYTASAEVVGVNSANGQVILRVDTAALQLFGSLMAEDVVIHVDARKRVSTRLVDPSAIASAAK